MNNMKKNWTKKAKKIFKIISLASLVGLFIYQRKQDILDHIDEKATDLVEAVKKEEQECGHFYLRLRRKLKCYFIPHEANNNHPLSLRPKKLVGYALLLICIKIAVTGFLFFYYPTPAELANIVTSKIVEMANQDRIENGVEPLNLNVNLTKYAMAKAQDMIDKDYFSHDSPDGRKPWLWIDRVEYDYIYAGENLAMDFSSAELIHQAFMKSPTHQKNILNPNYKDIGVAVVSGEINGRQTDVLVQFFGTQRLQREEVVKVSQPTNIQPTNQVETKVVGEATGNEVVAGESAEFAVDSPGIIVVSANTSARKSITDAMIEYTNIFFIAFLIFISVALILNVIIKVRIQQPKVILQSLAVIALVTALILVKFHFVEHIGEQLLIL